MFLIKYFLIKQQLEDNYQETGLPVSMKYKLLFSMKLTVHSKTKAHRMLFKNGI